MKTTFVIDGHTIECDSTLVPAIIAQMCGPTPAPKPKKPTAKPKAVAPKPSAPKIKSPVTPAKARGYQWYDAFASEHTTITLKRDTVQVKVARGYASDWHDKLRHAGFKWSKKGFWWASLDAQKRSAIAERNIANDAATAGMTKEERREYWRERNASRA